MATAIAQSQLSRRVPAALLGALIAAIALPGARAQYEPSGYQRLQGEPFFLLSDKSFGSNDIAQVRLELATRAFGMTQVERYGGVDVVLYRVPKPLDFLERQTNLHRVQLDAVPADEGLANTLSHLWDKWYKASRLAWQGIFTPQARLAVTGQAPELKTAMHATTAFGNPPQFKPLPGFDLVDRFRYPVHQAAPIEAPKGVALAGSSSEFIAPSAGNVMIPLGQLKPGLYVVEAYVGANRAITLVFVSDTVAITKTSLSEMLVWAAGRVQGGAVADVAVAWTDGSGVLQSGKTDAQGVVRFPRSAPERSYVIGSDKAGGVFISENFYYDSEIYDAKLYAVTDRPLYRPGDQVFLKFIGREFQSARKSLPIAAGEIALTVYDPNGAPVATQKFKITPDTGADTSFRLPENATTGGYELRFAYKDGQYSAAFRVAEYQKPHFEITLVADKADFKTRQPVAGRLQLAYPDGRPVRDAQIQLNVRAQQLTMLEGELRYGGQFPLKLTTETLRTDARGEARFSLPAAEEPSRYVLTAFATDGAAYRVKTTKELLIERGKSAYTLKAARHFTAPNETITFSIQPVADAQVPPVSWEWIRLEDRQHANGKLATPDRLELSFAQSGSYTVQLRDARGNLVGAASHWVSGSGLRAPAGSIEIVLDKDKFQPGETAEALITFPEEVNEALLTLERDRVEQTALLKTAGGWVNATRIAPTQWRARIPVAADFSPNITFSVAYVKGGDYVFQNQGLQVAQPRIEVAVTADKAVYAPGETANVEVATLVDGKPVAASITVGVVDEMVYVLQPEITPDIGDFFYHPRRNNVRTASSLTFIAYDLATTRSKGAPSPRAINQRGVKVLERPRRDEMDTAFWEPTLRTDASGHARFSFVVPDALTRWRVTARAFSADGIVGQRTAYVRSDKNFYVKWTSPNWMRQGDAPVASIAAFNQTTSAQKVEVSVAGLGLKRADQLTLKPGANYVAVPLGTLSGDGAIAVTLRKDGKIVDALETRFAQLPAAWRSPRTVAMALSGARTSIGLPPDARNLRVTLASSSAAQFSRIVGDLIEYPYGCIEQTASRMIPFALAIQALGTDQQRMGDRLRQQLSGQRLRLAYMAGPNATFAWWGPFTTGDPFMTAYAYYADWIATRALGVELPAEHWNRLLDVYSQGGHALPLSQRALVLSWMQQMRLPVKGLAEGLFADLQKNPFNAASAKAARLTLGTSALLGAPETPLPRAEALALAERISREGKLPLPPGVSRQLDAAYSALKASRSPAAEALMIANGRLPPADAERVLGAVRAEMPTLERAMTLVWLDHALGGPTTESLAATALESPWQSSASSSGAVLWRWPAGTALPTELRLAQAPIKPIAAIIQFESSSKEAHDLPVTIERRLYRMVKRIEEAPTDKQTGDRDREEGRSGTAPPEENYELDPVQPNSPLATDSLYLDEIVLRPTGAPLRYLLVEAALPPGAAVESTTWGMRLGGNALEQARHESTPYGYAVPVEPLNAPVTLRHLLRFAQKGRYVLPPTRAYRMYQPDLKGFESGDAQRVLEVR